MLRPASTGGPTDRSGVLQGGNRTGCNDCRAGKVNMMPFPPNLDLTTISRAPTTLPPETVKSVLGRTLPITSSSVPVQPGPNPQASVVVVTFNNLVFSRLCIESLLQNTTNVRYELI